MAVRLGGHLTALAAVFVAAWGVETTVPVPAVADRTMAAAVDSAGLPASAGLAPSAGGYTLTPGVDTLAPGAPAEFEFTITGPDSRPVIAFDELRLDVVRRDAAGFQRLDPRPGPEGRWRATVTLPAGGVYRVYADLVPVGGPALNLGVDLFAPGDFTPIPLPPSRVSQVDGYQVRLDGVPVPGRATPVFATVTRDGAPVADLEPVGDGFGRLVALRRGDLAHLQLRPDAVAAAGDRAGPGIAFTARLPTPGGHRLFLDFRHGGVLHTAEFTLDVPAPA